MTAVPFYCLCCGAGFWMDVLGRIRPEGDWSLICPVCGEMWAAVPDTLRDDFPWEVMD